ncbi:MAG: replicative DNA helicase, partial [Candidatus Moraniibacteriota bacterium]
MATSENKDLKLPPQNIDAEKSVLGALMLDKDAIIRVANLVRLGDFYKDTHNLIYETMIDLYEKREPIDVLSLSNRLEEKGQLDTIGGSSYLATLVNTVPSSSNVSHYAKVVQKKSTLRKLIETASEIVELGYHEEEDVDKLLDEAEQKLFAVSQKYIKQDFVPIRSILEAAFNRIDELHKGDHQLRGIPTGYTDLNNVLAGFQKSDLIILAARPSIGKSTLAMDFARSIAVKEKIGVGVFSLEMGADQLIDRMLAAQSGVDLWRLRTGRLKTGDGDDDFQRIGEAMGVLSEAPIFIDDSGSANIMEIRTMARRLQMEHNVG